jgi:hypothetical protein
MGADEIEAALLVTNNKRCDPPLAEDEARKITSIICRYKPARDSFSITDYNDPNDSNFRAIFPRFTPEAIKANQALIVSGMARSIEEVIRAASRVRREKITWFPRLICASCLPAAACYAFSSLKQRRYPSISST